MVKPGRPLRYSDKAIGEVLCLMMRKHIGKYKTLHTYLKDHPDDMKVCGLETLPSRRTLGRRLKEHLDAVLAPIFKSTGREKIIFIKRDKSCAK